MVTGACGIGQAIARALCGARAEVILSNIDREAALATARELKGNGFKATVMILDVIDTPAVKAAVAETARPHGCVDNPAFRLACGRLPDTGADLCSQPTLSRLENARASATSSASPTLWM